MNLSVGLDVSKNTVDVCFYETKQFYVIDNNQTGFTELIDKIREFEKQNYVVHVCCESTGNYYLSLATHIYQSNIAISVVNPLSIKRYAQMKLNRVKTDKRDAQLIADYCKSQKPQFWQPLSHDRQRLQALHRRLEQLIHMQTQEKNRIHVANDEICRNSINRTIAFLSIEIQQCRESVQQLIDENEQLKRQQQILMTIPGVGKTTASLLLSLLVDIDKFKTSKHLISYLGLSPVIRESGTSVRGSRISKMGDRTMRKALYMPARSACVRSKIWRQWFDNKIKQGKKVKQIYVLMMCKILKYSFVCLKNNEEFNADLHKHVDN